MRIFIIITLFLFNAALVRSQNDLIMYGSKAGTKAHLMNPAKAPDYKLYFSFPGLGSESLCLLTSLRPSDILTDEADGTTTIDIPKLLTRLKPENSIELNFDANLLYVGFELKEKGYLSFGVDHHTTFMGNFSKELLTFLGKGNAAYLNENVNFSKEQVGFLQYHTFNAGYTHYINEKINAGIRLKWIKGMGHAQLERWNANVYTDENSVPAYSIDAEVDFNALVAGTAEYILDDTGNNSFEIGDAIGRGNGFGLDVGVVYKPYAQWEFSFAATDLLGRINWKEDYAREITLSGDGEFQFDGFEASLDDDSETDFDEELEELEKELEETFDLEETPHSYSNNIGTSVLLAGTWRSETKAHELTVLYRGSNKFDRFRHGAGLVYHYTPFSFLQLSAAYSWLQASSANLGFGLVLKAGPVQLHAYTNDVISLANQENARHVSFLTGLNFVFGKKVKKENPVEEEAPRKVESYF